MRFLLTLIIIAASAYSPLASAGGQGGVPYFIANEGQWEGDFQFKCEVGSTIYYITPHGMTVDFREVTNDVGAAGVPPAPDRFGTEQHTNFAERGLSEAVPRRNLEVRGHVIQIHYLIPPRFSGGARGGDSGLPPFTSAEMGGLRGASASDSPLPAGGQRAASAFGTNKLPHYSNYFLTKDSTKWRSRVPHFENIIVPEVWPGIAVEYRAAKLGVETIYHVQSGADPTQIQMEYLGLDQPLQIDAHDNLILATSLGDLKEQAPYSYQQQSRVQQKITSSVRLLGENRIGFNLGEFDRTKELVIDPLLYSTYFGADGGAEDITRFLVLSTGEKLLCGTSGSTNFPTTPGAYQEELTGLNNAYVTKLAVDATDILFSTLFGASGYVNARDIELMQNGDILLIGYVSNPGAIPLTLNALDTIKSELEGFVALFSNDGSELLYSGYLGGSGNDIPLDLVVDQTGRAIMIGGTGSQDFPVTPNALYPEGGSTLIVIMDVIPPVLHYASFWGGVDALASGRHIVQASGNVIWLVGAVSSEELSLTDDALQSEFGGIADAFLSKIQLEPPANLYTTYLGGSGYDEVTGFEVISDSVLALFGHTGSTEWPTTPEAFDTVKNVLGYDGFVTVFRQPNSIVYSTLLGEDDYEHIESGMQTPDGSYMVAGDTRNENFPITPDALDSTFGPNIGDVPRDLFITRFSPDLSSLEYSTFFGGNDLEYPLYMWMSNASTLWLAGETQSNDFPVTPDAMRPEIDFWGYDVFISCIGLTTTGVGQPNVALPKQLDVSVFPNPFNSTLSISLNIPLHQELSLTLYDLLGREVEVIHHGRLNSPTLSYTAPPTLASGIYFLRASTQTTSAIQKIALLK